MQTTQEIQLKCFNRAFFIGDVHLDARIPERETLFCKLLDQIILSNPDHVFLMGDIFEFWFGYKHVMFSHHIRAISKIAALRERNIPVTYLVGNHDFLPGYVFENLLRIEVIHNPIIIRCGEIRIYLSHGDEINTADKGYKVLKRILRNRIAQAFFKVIPPALAWQLGRLTSDTSRRCTSQKKSEIPTEIYRRFMEKLAQEDISVVVHGHTHVAGCEQFVFDEKLVTVYNSGHWFGPCHYLEYCDGNFHSRTMNG